jgi:hypothetical protein
VWDYLADASLGYKWAAALPTVPRHRTVPSTAGLPTVTSVNLPTGDIGGGDSVTVSGTQLEDAYLVTFNGIAGTIFGVPVASSLVSITPPGLAVGAVTVRVVTPQGVGVLANGFTYTSGAGGSDGLTTEAGDQLLTESGDYLEWEP